MIQLYNRLKLKKVQFVYLPLLFYWLILLTLTSLPGKELPKALEFNDKLEHLIGYTILSLLIALALHFQTKFPVISKNFFLATVLIIAIYAGLDEIHQLFIPNRSCDFFDWLADMLGAILGGSISYFFVRKFKNNQ